MLTFHSDYIVGTKVPFLQSNPKLGFKSALALIQMTLGGSKFCGKTSMFDMAKFLHEVSVLHSTMIASVRDRFGRPTSYQHGYKIVVSKTYSFHWA